MTVGRQQRFDLSAAEGDVAAEVDRMVAIGARVLGDSEGGVLTLTDPTDRNFGSSTAERLGSACATAPKAGIRRSLQSGRR